MKIKSQLVRADTKGVSASRKSVMPQQIASFLLSFVIGAAPVASVQGSTSATLARLEVKISTTSPWTSVTLRPGRVAAQRIVSVPSDVKVTPTEAGWVLNSPSGKMRTVVVRAVFEEPAGASTVRVSVSKGRTGSTKVDLVNQSAKPFVATRILNQLPRSTNATKARDGLTAVMALTRYELFGSSDPVMPEADPQRLVLAAYYPWYGPVYGNQQFADRPSDPRSTGTYQGVLSMTEQARSAGVDGFLVSWQGEAFSGKRFDLALRAAERTGGVVTPYIEMAIANAAGDTSGRADPLVVLEWLSDTLDRADSPGFLRSDGIPVVFVYRIGMLSRIGWLNVLSELGKRGDRVRLVGDASMSNFGMIQWGVHSYNPNFQTPAALEAHNRRTALDARLLGSTDPKAPHLYVATVSPGYDDRKVPGRTSPVVQRGNAGEHYLATWDAALAAQPDWVLITSWNEWFEGTSVEPSVSHGDLALRQTAEQTARFAA